MLFCAYSSFSSLFTDLWEFLPSVKGITQETAKDKLQIGTSETKDIYISKSYSDFLK